MTNSAEMRENTLRTGVNGAVEVGAAAAKVAAGLALGTALNPIEFVLGAALTNIGVDAAKKPAKERLEERLKVKKAA